MDTAELLEIATLPHSEARERLRAGSPVYLPVNPVEYHGPHLPLNNDYLLSLGSIRAVHARLFPGEAALVAPPIHAGVGPIRAAGSIPVPYREVRRLVLSSCRALEDMGARSVFVMTFHGEPLHNLALEEGVTYLRSRGIRAAAPFHLVVRELLEYRPGRFERAIAPVRDPGTREMISREMGLDFHAGFFETSLMLHWWPDKVSPEYRDLPPCPPFAPHKGVRALERAARLAGRAALAGELGFLGHGLGWLGLKPFPGYTGWPHLANAETGAIFEEEIIGRYEESLRGVLAGSAEAPRPNIAWLKPLSLGGRIAPTGP